MKKIFDNVEFDVMKEALEDYIDGSTQFVSHHRGQEAGKQYYEWIKPFTFKLIDKLESLSNLEEDAT